MPLTYFLVLFFVIVTVVSIYAIIRNENKTKKRLEQIRDSNVSTKTEIKEKKTFISLDKFQKTRLASNENIKKLVVQVSNELTAAGLGDDPLRLLFVWIIIVIILPMIENLLGIDIIFIFLTIGVSAFGPVAYIQFKKGKRKELFEKQLPNALNILCNALKAGYTFQYSMNTVAKELDDPIAEEFLMAFRETQYGIPLTDALQNMAKRTDSADVELLNIAVSVQTTVGGNMIEILENIANTLTAKHDLEEDIKVKTASGKITGIMLGVLPVVLMIAMHFLNPEYIQIFFEEKLGQYMLIFCVVWELIGFVFIRKILNVKF